jgi:predicted P-loop ATPase
MPVSSPVVSRSSSVHANNTSIRNSLASVVSALESLPAWAGVLATDLGDARVVFRKPPPFPLADAGCGDERPPDDSPPAVRDRDMDRIRHWFEAELDVRLSKQTVVDAVRIVADRHAFHPVRDYLTRLEWDGAPRVDGWLERYAAVRPQSDAHAALVRSVARKWLVAAVARAMRPGCKVDTMLILEGRQGIGKSRALATLAGERFFSDAAIDFGSKDACQTIQGVWIFELAELDAILRRDPATTKAFVSRATDRFREPYGRTTESVPRGVVFAGTVNHGAYLRDTTGNRRYWIVRCEAPLDVEGLAEARDQIWAEALHLHRAGETWHLGEADERSMSAETEARLEGDPWEESLAVWTAARTVKEADRPFTMEEVLRDALDLRTSSRNPKVTARVSRLLSRLGYERRRRATLPRGYHYIRVDVPPSHRPTGFELTSEAADSGSASAAVPVPVPASASVPASVSATHHPRSSL